MLFVVYREGMVQRGIMGERGGLYFKRRKYESNRN